MKITVMEGKRLPGEEPELVVYCHKADRNIEAICKYAGNMGSYLIGINGNDTCRLEPEDILYFETVDGKVFAYLKEKVWQVGKSLEALENQYSGGMGIDYFRVSKSCMVNLKYVEHLTSTIGNRIIAHMENGEMVMISRHYAKLLRAYLKAGKGDEDV